MLKLFSQTQASDFLYDVLSYNRPDSAISNRIPSSLQHRKFINWMSFLIDETYIHEMSFPATLHSAIYNLKSNEIILKNQPSLKLLEKNLINENLQKYDLFSQLMAGVRFMSFDCQLNSENVGVFCFGDKESIKMKDGLLQIHDFFERFNQRSTEFMFLSFKFQCKSQETQETLKKLIGKTLNIESFALKRKDFTRSLKINDIQKNKIRYILLCDPIQTYNDDYFISENDAILTNSLNNLFKNAKSIEITTNLLISQEYSTICEDLTPAFFEKTYGKLIDSHLQNLIIDFHNKTQKIPNICSRQLIDQSPTFIGNVIFLNHLKGLFKINEYLALLFHTNDQFFADYSLEKCLKYSNFGSFKLGLPNLPGRIMVYNQKITHQVFFESLLTTCFTKREEDLKIEAPEGFILSHLDIYSESKDKTNKFKIVITDGWVMERSICLRIKALTNFYVEICAEAIPLTKKIVFYSES